MKLFVKKIKQKYSKILVALFLSLKRVIDKYHVYGFTSLSQFYSLPKRISYHIYYFFLKTGAIFSNYCLDTDL